MTSTPRVRKPAARTAAKHITTAPAKPAAKAAAKAPASPAPKASAKKAVAAKADKPKKLKLVRDTFAMPKAEFAALDALKARAAKAGVQTKKSVLIRAGLRVLAAMSDSVLTNALRAVPVNKAAVAAAAPSEKSGKK